MLCSHNKVSYVKENVIKKAISKIHFFNTVLYRKKSTYKWTCAVQTGVGQGLTVYVSVMKGFKKGI